MPYYRRNLYVLSLTIFLAAISWNQVIPFLGPFLKDLGISDQTKLNYWIGVVFALQAGSSIFAQPLWGKLGDIHGRKPMILRAGFFLTFIYFGMSFCQQPWQLAMFRFLNGALTGFIPGSIALIGTNTPEQLTPRAVATAQAAGAAGLIFGPALGDFLADIAGYRGSMQVSGTAVFISTLLVWWLVKEPNKVTNVQRTSILEDMVLSAKSPVLVAVLFSLIIHTIFGAAIGPFLVLYLEDMGTAWTGAILALPAVAFVIFARVWTKFGEKKSFNAAIVVGLLGGGLGSVTLAFAPNAGLFAILYFVTGIFLAAVPPATASLVSLRVKNEFRGRAYGLQHAAATTGAFIAPLVAGWLRAEYGTPAIFVFVGIVFLAGTVAFHVLAKRRMKSDIELAEQQA